MTARNVAEQVCHEDRRRVSTPPFVDPAAVVCPPPGGPLRSSAEERRALARDIDRMSDREVEPNQRNNRADG